jgi:hypothetical protein
LRTQLAAIGGLRTAHLVRKRVTAFPERPCFVLAFGVAGWLSRHHAELAASTQRRIVESVRFPGETLIVNVEGANRWIARKLWWQRGSRVM